MKSILHLQTELNLSCGVSKTIYLIIKNSSKNFQHHIISLGGNGLERFKQIDHIPRILKRNRHSLYGTVRILLHLLSYCYHNNINILHSHHRYFDTIIWILRKLLKVKTIMSVHNNVFGRKYLSYKSDILLACSYSVKNHLVENFSIDENKIYIIPNFIDTEDIKITLSSDELKNSLGITQKIIIGFVGRLNYSKKGIDILLEAFESLKKLNKKLFLIIIGSGKDEREIRKHILNNKNSVALISSKIDIYNYYNIIDIIVLPSREEAFGIVQLEAGAMKKPVISTSVGGIVEVIDDGKDGLLISPGNVNELVKALLKIISNPNYANLLGMNLYNKVLTNYTAKQIIPIYQNLYNKLLNRY